MRMIEFLTPQYWLKWIRSESLWVYSVSTGCCPDEWVAALSNRYDIERFGIKVVEEPELADVLVIQANLNEAIIKELRGIYERMKTPKYVIALGSCAAYGGVCSGEPGNRGTELKLQATMPVDFFLSGCPPRPEAIMHAFLKLKDRIRT